MKIETRGERLGKLSGLTGTPLNLFTWEHVAFGKWSFSSLESRRWLLQLVLCVAGGSYGPCWVSLPLASICEPWGVDIWQPHVLCSAMYFKADTSHNFQVSEDITVKKASCCFEKHCCVLNVISLLQSFFRSLGELMLRNSVQLLGLFVLALEVISQYFPHITWRSRSRKLQWQMLTKKRREKSPMNQGTIPQQFLL